jgi:hypothetical protein
MKLEQGKRYASRTGETTTPLIKNRNGNFQGKLGRKDFSWGPDGTFGFGTDSDTVLVREVTE